MKRALPTSRAALSSRPRTPLPATLAKSSTSPLARFFSRADRTMACASGCSESRSRLAARRSTSSGGNVHADRFNRRRRWACPRSACRSCRAQPRRSSVRAPSASPFLMRMPRRAPTPVPTMMAVGVAKPSEQGQAISRTATAGTKLCVTSPVNRYQPRAVASCDAEHHRHEDSRHPVGKLLDRSLVALRFRDHAHDLRQHGVLRRPWWRASGMRPRD